ncbi:MAG: YabP/YqfC family sporulation protein [Clostridia bacterium]|nr:YabP/YqfC family sporulation protein [Clostridia bacterium]
MNLFKESIRSLKLDGFLPLPFCINVFGGQGARVENVKKITEIRPEKISLSVEKGDVVLTGENLFIIAYDGGDVSIGGKITGVKIDR